MQSLNRIAVFLLAFIMALQVIISPSYADWEVSGGGNGSSGVAGDGTYVDDMQGSPFRGLFFVVQKVACQVAGGVGGPPRVRAGCWTWAGHKAGNKVWYAFRNSMNC